MAKLSRATITNKVLLEHMQAGHEALRTELTREIRRSHTELTREIHRLDAKIETMGKDITELKRNDERTHAALQRLYERRLEVVEQLTDHEKRLVRLEGAAA